MADRPTASPRLQPLSTAEIQQLWAKLAGKPPSEAGARLHISRTWAHDPALMVAQSPLQRHLLYESPLPARLRELAILRIGWRCSAPYEVSQHVTIGRRAGLTDQEIAALMVEDPGSQWEPVELAAIRAADELYTLHTLTDETWNQLTEHLDIPQCIDLLAVIGRYWTVSVVSNALRIELEEEAVFLDVEGAPRTYGRA